MENKLRPERRSHAQLVHIDRRRGIVDLIEHVIRGVQWEYVRTEDEGIFPRAVWYVGPRFSPA